MQPIDWRTIGALNAVSALAQVGQYGIAFVVLPVWLAERGLDATQLGAFAASMWLGQLLGLGIAPWLCKRFGSRRIVIAGLLCTVVALPMVAVAGWPIWLLSAMLVGVGLGLRWIGVEPWLYRIAPGSARGRLVGIHESLLALAPIVAPVLSSIFGLRGVAIFWIGAAFTMLALVPLAFARSVADQETLPDVDVGTASLRAPLRELIFRQSVVIALLGGLMDAALSGLFALFTQGRGMSAGQTAELLAVFGVGGLLMQYGVGWLADHRGVGSAAMYSAIGTALTSVALVLPLSNQLVAVAVFLLGGFTTAFLTLAIIAGTSTESGSMARNVSMVSMLFTASAVVGPLIAGAVIKASNADALMWFTAVAAGLMACALGWMAPARLKTAA